VLHQLRTCEHLFLFSKCLSLMSFLPGCLTYLYGKVATTQVSSLLKTWVLLLEFLSGKKAWDYISIT
jgi:hypothetical protein